MDFVQAFISLYVRRYSAGIHYAKLLLHIGNHKKKIKK